MSGYEDERHRHHTENGEERQNDDEEDAAFSPLHSTCHNRFSTTVVAGRHARPIHAFAGPVASCPKRSDRPRQAGYCHFKLSEIVTGPV